MISESNYDKLREIKGCESMQDLAGAALSRKAMTEIADCMEIEESDTYIDISPSVKDLKISYLKILKKSRQLSKDKKLHRIIVYVGGHGASDQLSQILLLNDSNPKKAPFHIEYKLRYLLSCQPGSTAHIMVLFECSRVKLDSIPELKSGPWAGLENEENSVAGVDSTCRYF